MNLKEKTVVIDNKTYRYSKIVMLESKEKSPLILNQFGGLQLSNKIGVKCNLGQRQPINLSTKKFQHLYFLSTDKICEGDWYFDLSDKKLYRKGGFFPKYTEVERFKVISSTDPSLNLPKPSKQFLQIYIFAYNKNEKIEECLVEYTKHFDEGWTDEGGAFEIEYKALKVTKGEITIRKVKESWSREEIEEILNKYNSTHDCILDEVRRKYVIKEWIEQNL